LSPILTTGQRHARWLAWGALNLTSDVIYASPRPRGTGTPVHYYNWLMCRQTPAGPWGTGTPAHYYNWLMYRQTHAGPTFTQSLAAVHELAPHPQRTAAGPYWPTTGYCTRTGFEIHGIRCLQY